MISIKEDKLIIELEHPNPLEALKNLQISLVIVLQAQFIQEVNEVDDDLVYANYQLLELLKQLLKK